MQYPVLFCFYCDAAVQRPWEYQRDHFPIPNSAGGEDTVIACVRCHHMKDRAPNDELQAEFDEALRVAPAAALIAYDAILNARETHGPIGMYAALLGSFSQVPLPMRWTAARLIANDYRQAKGARRP